VQVGTEYENFVRDCLNPFGAIFWHWEDKTLQLFGENRQGWEVKYDYRCFSRNPNGDGTNRLSIELREKSERGNARWIEGGILRNDNTWMYVQGNYEIIFVFAKNWLRRVYEEKITAEDITTFNGTVQRFYLPIDPDALRGAALILEVVDKAKRQATPLRKDEKGQWRL